ncbi:translation termination factor eRF1 [Coemansia biformis]|uniref:Eukaryotic peptide chain release factor subunit 1 n=1 Tax=Coemansia biformis TaxID=1286918 RepID=A0A9W8CXF6_9FUNG|nr:translation termination factor eRF1 [Coemansia biformis]
MDTHDADREAMLWRTKNLVKELGALQGNGTTLISIAIPPGKQISQVTRMLTDEYGATANIKSRVTKQLTQAAITSTQQRLRQYTRLPPNGLLVYCGKVQTSDGRERMVVISHQPPKPVSQSIYLCGNRFHTEPLEMMLEDDRRFGFIVMDGKGCLYGVLSGSSRTVLHSFSVSLPKKHGRGGQSSMRFARIREEKRHNYVHKVAEKATQLFITNNMPNVVGLVLAGSADFKDELQKSDLFDKRLAPKVLHVVDVSYGGETGFNQAIELSEPYIDNMKLMQEKQLFSRYFDDMALDPGKITYGHRDTLDALREGAVETLIVWEDLDIVRCVFRDTEGATVERCLTRAEEQDRSAFLSATGAELELVSRESLVEWLIEEHKNHGAKLSIISDSSAEGVQFVKGFGGIGGMLRWRQDRYDYESEYEDCDSDEICADDSGVDF